MIEIQVNPVNHRLQSLISAIQRVQTLILVKVTGAQVKLDSLKKANRNQRTVAKADEDPMAEVEISVQHAEHPS